MTRRFWQQASIRPEAGGHAVLLDGRPVRTPGRLPLVLPGVALAEAIAAEWQAVGDEVNPRAMPLTGLANAAIERIAPDPAPFADGIARYGQSDLLCYRADQPVMLAERQATAWKPILAWAEARYAVEFAITAGIVHVAQPEATIAALAAAVAALDPYALAALSPIVSITGTLVGGLALTEAALTADALWTAAHVDEDWQAELWGADAEAQRTRAAHRAEFAAAAAFLTLSRA